MIVRGISLWSKKPIFWEDEHHRYCSVVFSWQLYDLIEYYKSNKPRTTKQIVIGGPATIILRHIIPEEILVRNNLPSLFRHNPLATRTSTGCLRNCKFCMVRKVEGKLKELKDWENKPIVIDNNLLLCSQKHFDKVIDKLKLLDWCDFNQGLDSRLLTKHHAERFAELNNPLIRISFDHTKIEKYFLNAHQLLRNEGIPNNRIRVYVLIGFNDTPEDALYRLELAVSLGILTSPMRYQPIDTLKKHSFVHENWTDKELKRYMSYWSNLIHYRPIPFKEFHL